ncbi:MULTISPECIES: hypothetical protein [Haloferax]|uniref:Uncharacterized protein n=1 Tax=Haloferax massiliensis TaxID=1476858 RepID=A0A0D6JVT1_9EURY|nr:MULTISPECIES: hypothetical protein [Haloferax]MDS0242279.1 hypothetical protein [Haloferax sp. S2CR25]MDS0445400.1 hypothetical protein [Haloferax sp. S2CR25-2]CQR53107.1 hypothetical protein BN996_03463 [Haloferax massiliensis]
MDRDEPERREPSDSPATTPELDESEIEALVEYVESGRARGQRVEHGGEDRNGRGGRDDRDGRKAAVERFRGPDEVLTRVVPHAGYLEIHKRTPCAEGCASCPHGPAVYHVRWERHPGGEDRLHWVLIGPEVGAN